jgi:hypothetical protein
MLGAHSARGPIPFFVRRTDRARTLILVGCPYDRASIHYVTNANDSSLTIQPSSPALLSVVIDATIHLQLFTRSFIKRQIKELLYDWTRTRRLRKFGVAFPTRKFNKTCQHGLKWCTQRRRIPCRFSNMYVWCMIPKIQSRLDACALFQRSSQKLRFVLPRRCLSPEIEGDLAS